MFAVVVAVSTLAPPTPSLADTLALWRLQLLSSIPPQQNQNQNQSSMVGVQPRPAPRMQARLASSAWSRFCHRQDEQGDQQVCFVGRIQAGKPPLTVLLIEPSGQGRAMLRVTLPLGMQLAWGTRVLVDHGQPMHAPYVACGSTGCFADYEASSELIEELKHAQGLTVEGVDGRGQTSSAVVPLAGFGDAYEGPATDPKAFEERLKQLAHEQPRAASPILK